MTILSLLITIICTITVPHTHTVYHQLHVNNNISASSAISSATSAVILAAIFSTLLSSAPMPRSALHPAFCCKMKKTLLSSNDYQCKWLFFMLMLLSLYTCNNETHYVELLYCDWKYNCCTYVLLYMALA